MEKPQLCRLVLDRKQVLLRQLVAAQRKLDERDGGARPVVHQQRQQLEYLPGIEEVGRIERITEITRLLAADPGKREHQRADQQPRRDGKLDG